MKYAFGGVLATASLWMASLAPAQTGLYGSPEMIPLQVTATSPTQPPVCPSSPAMVAPQTVAPVTFPSVAANTAFDSQTRYDTMPVSYGQGYTGYVAQTAPATPPPPAKDVPIAAPAKPAPPASSAPSVLDQLLQESGGVPTAECVTPGGCEAGYTSTPYASCDDNLCDAPCVPSPWYASAAGLYMTRDRGKRLWTTYQTNNNPNQLMNTNDASADWRGGGEIRLGRRFCCSTWALEGTFWALDSLQGHSSIQWLGGNLSTPEDFDHFTGPGSLFNNADVHIINRRDEIYDAELNLMRTPLCCGPINIDWLVGFRWFHFREHLNWGTLGQDGSWSNPDDVAYLDDSIENNLFGGQVGLAAKWDVGYHLSLFARPKIGLYGNYMDHRFNIYNGAGTSFQPDPGSGIVDTFPGASHGSTFSVLTEIDAGLQWQYHEHWSAFLGYRLIAATGIGLADEQIPFYPVDIPEWQEIDKTGHLLLHGVFAGLQYNF